MRKKMTELLRDKKWSAFTIEALFRIEKVSGLPTENYKDGKAPYISTSSTNNGLINFVLARGNIVAKTKSRENTALNEIVFFIVMKLGRKSNKFQTNLVFLQANNLNETATSHISDIVPPDSDFLCHGATLRRRPDAGSHPLHHEHQRQRQHTVPPRLHRWRAHRPHPHTFRLRCRNRRALFTTGR